MGALDCRPGKTHAFDVTSGWCGHGCGVRDDRRVITRAGDAARDALPRPTEDIRHRIDPRGEE